MPVTYARLVETGVYPPGKHAPMRRTTPVARRDDAWEIASVARFRR